MTFRNVILTTACALVAAAGLHAQGPCMSFMLSGTYMVKITGYATVATSPIPIFAPLAAVGSGKVDESGNMTVLVPLTTMVGGMPETNILTSSKLTMGSDCSVSFKASCSNGCNWEGTGLLLRGGQTKEIHLVFTKSDGYPLTAFVEMKQISN